MARQPNDNGSARLYLRPSKEVAWYLDELARMGIHGKTPSEVAKTLVGNEIERLVREGILKLRARSGGPKR